ncbi:MAG: glycosyltransferase [Clostridia bacterium]|nr:glycosyltransferase [Clostridia bacterium]
MPDKSAAANRVVSNGKIFSALGYRTVFIGVSEEQFNGMRPVAACKDMFETAHPESTSQWVKHMLSVEHIVSLADKYGDVCKVILYNVPMFTLIKAKKVFSKRNVEVCYDCTEWTKDTDGSLPKRLFKAFDEILISNYAHRVADGIIAISSMMEKKYKKSKKLLVLPPLIDVNDEIWHQQSESHKGVFEFCFAGIPDAKKESLDKIVEAFLSIDRSDICLRIIGVEREDFNQIYPDCIITEAASDKIVFMGRLSHKETVKYILGCDCYIFIRRSDKRNNAGFPTKFTESFTCGVPIITTDVSDVGGYIKKSGRGCLLANMAKENISVAMLCQIKNKNQPNKLDKTFHYESFIKPTENWLK